MPFCFLCKVNILEPLLCKHFKIQHTNHDFSSYICAEKDCNRSFHVINSYKKHLTTHMLTKRKVIENIQHLKDSTSVTINNSVDNIGTISDTYPFYS